MSRSLPTTDQLLTALDDWRLFDQLGTLRNLMDRVSLADLPQFDLVVRSVFLSAQSGGSLRQFFRPEQVRAGAAWLAGQPALLAVLAGHPNGYVRELAVSLLAQHPTPWTTGLLLVRLNDWVAPVRRRAQEALHDRLAVSDLPLLLPNLPLVLRLLDQVRAPNLELVLRVLELLDSFEGQEHLAATFSGLNTTTRLILVHQLLTRVPPPIALIQLFQQDPAASVRRAAIPHLGAEDLRSALADRDGGVRALALRRLLLSLTPQQAVGQASLALLDPQERVRLLAQYTLRHLGLDVRATYLQLDPGILPEPQLRGWIAGLASEKQKEDGASIAPFLTHPSSRVRLEALYAVGTLDPATFRFALADGALDTGPVSRTALRLMRKGGLLDSPALIEHMLTQATTEKLKRRVLRLALDLERFRAVELLLRWREGLAPALREEIGALLVQLLNGYGRTYYTRPPDELLAELKASAHSSSGLQRVLAAYS